MREISYQKAISEAHVQSLEMDKNAFIMGVGVADPKGLFNTTLDAFKKFGTARVFDTPMSENTLTGMCVGAAMLGSRPVLVHARNDFLFLTLDQIVNHAAKWRYMSGGKLKTPILVRAIVGRGWGGAAQHSQTLQATLAHFPGLQVVIPSAPYDVKGLILAAMKSDMATVCIEHRWLFEKTGPVPEEPYTIPFGKGNIVRKGKDVTVVALSQMVLEAKTAAEECAKEGIDVEIIDPRSVRPLDEAMILESLKKTGRLIVADTSWITYGVSAEIAALAVEKGFETLKAPVIRIGLPDSPTPCSSVLEAAFYPTAKHIVQAVHKLVRGEAKGDAKDFVDHEIKAARKEFTGPF